MNRPSHTMERTADRCAFHFEMACTLPLRSTRGLARASLILCSLGVIPHVQLSSRGNHQPSALSCSRSKSDRDRAQRPLQSAARRTTRTTLRGSNLLILRFVYLFVREAVWPAVSARIRKSPRAVDKCDGRSASVRIRRSPTSCHSVVYLMSSSHPPRAGLILRAGHVSGGSIFTGARIPITPISTQPQSSPIVVTSMQHDLAGLYHLRALRKSRSVLGPVISRYKRFNQQYVGCSLPL